MRTRLIVFAAFVLVAGNVFAQAAPRTPQAPPAPAAPAAPPAPAASPATPAPPAPPAPPRREGQPINVKVELNITEDGGAGAPIKKSVTAVVADGYNGFVRQQGFAQNPSAPQLNLVVPLNLESGKPLVISQGTDPIGDRRVTVEVTATILK